MERKNFMKSVGLLAVTLVLSFITSCGNQALTSLNEGKEIYEWRIYTLTGDGTELDSYFMDVLIPTYNRKGIKIGAFKPYALKEDEQDTRHIVFIYPDLPTYHKVRAEIWNDDIFTQAGQSFFDISAPRRSQIYSNIETYLSEAFSKIPTHRTPDRNRTLFELRIYWSGNEEANKRKVRMFNEGEIDVFDACEVNSVLYGDILAGPRMHALMYLTWYKDEETRAEAWNKFGAHPEWQRMSKLPEYANTATNNTSTFLAPMPYSQL